MKLADLLPPERIVIPLPARTLHDSAEQLIGAFVGTGLASDAAKLLERIGDTPAGEAVTVGRDAFILHCRSDTVNDVGAGLGVAPDPVNLEYDSTKSARIVVVVVAPYKESSNFLQAVSAFAQVLSRQEVVEAMLAATGASDVVEVPDFMAVELPGYLTVGDVMNARRVFVHPDATLAEAARLMVANRLPALPITSEGGEVLGLVTHREILRIALPTYLKRISSEIAGPQPPQDAGVVDPRMVEVRDVMDRSVLCVSEGQTLADVANMVMSKETALFPVVREGVLAGLLTRADLVRRLFGP